MIPEINEAGEACYKFIVASADEAVQVLREKLGENAKVISVRQVENGGLSRFLRAPNLEVIAQVDSKRKPLAPTPSIPRHEPVVPLVRPEVSVPDEMPVYSSAGDPFLRVLRRSGIEGSILASLKQHPDWERIVKRDLRSALDETGVLMRSLYQRREKRPLGNCVAFIGTPGVGKTTALCKRLAADVFLHGRPARVLKLDTDKANPGDGLAVFCEALGVPMQRQGELIEINAGETLYVDLPGISVGNKSEVEEIAGLLDPREVTRVLVLNAAYEVSSMKEAYRLGELLKATHVGFTHLDELIHWGKLWEFLFSPNFQPMFLSTGQNIAGNFTEDVFGAVFSKMFPVVGSEAA